MRTLQPSMLHGAAMIGTPQQRASDIWLHKHFGS
jgi:hypothetical protein